MKLFFAIIIALNSAFVCPPTDGAEFFFYEHKHKFPDTQQGVLLEHDYHFKNTGKQPLIIHKYEVACSCTKINFPKKPVLPGEEGTIHLTFDTNGKYGYQYRKVMIYSNVGKKPQIISFKVNVIPED